MRLIAYKSKSRPLSSCRFDENIIRLPLGKKKGPKLAELLLDSDLLEDDFVITETSFEEDNLESYLLDNSEIDLIIE